MQALKTRTKEFHFAELVRELREWLAARPDQSFMVVVWILPGSPGHAIVHLYERVLAAEDDPVWDESWERFRSGTPAYRDSRVKLLTKIMDGPKMVMSAVSKLGGEKPVVIGKKLKLHHFTGPNYVEIE